MSDTHKTVWFISEVYHPDEQGTAFFTTGLAEGLAKDFEVGVLCSYPTVTARGCRVPAREVRNGVLIERCRGTTLDKDVFWLRLVNIVSCSVAIFLKALGRVAKGDVVIAVTSPPSTPFIARLICLLCGARCVLRLEDVYPEVLVATDMIQRESLLNQILEKFNRWLYRSVDQIVVLGRDMKRLAEQKTQGHGNPVVLIRSWADTDIVFPQPREDNPLLRELGIQDKFVVSCIGNMGRAQAIELMIETAALLNDDPDIHFLFIGSGAKRGWMEKQVEERGLGNVTLLGQRPRADQINFLNACDISIISLLPGMTGAGVPSRTYNTMAAGKPIIALMSEDAEVALLVREENIGWAVPPTAAAGLAGAILNARSDPDRLKAMGNRACLAARERYSRETIIEKYAVLLRSMPGSTPDRGDRYYEAG